MYTYTLEILVFATYEAINLLSAFLQIRSSFTYRRDKKREEGKFAKEGVYFLFFYKLIEIKKIQIFFEI